MSDNRQVLRFFTLDPLHIGVGQDIMGEVDLPIDRESETNVPLTGAVIIIRFRTVITIIEIISSFFGNAFPATR